MKQLTPQHVPVYESSAEATQIWERCADRGQPVVAVRNATRGYIVRYDLQHLDRRLDTSGVREMRERARRFRSYPTGTDPISESEGVGGEAGPVSGELHTDSEQAGRRLAARLSEIVFDQSTWRTVRPDP
jgi:hypothetical protein